MAFSGKIPSIPSMGAQGVQMRNMVYDLVMRRTSTYVGAILVGAMVAENTVDIVADTIWSVNNKGVRLVCVTRRPGRAFRL